MDGSQSYASLPSTEDREGLAENSDVDSFTVNRDKNWRSSDFTRLSQSKRRTVVSTLRDYWWIYTSGLLVLIVGLQLAVWHELRSYLSDSSRQVGGDFTGMGPVCSSSKVLIASTLDSTNIM